MNPVERAKRFLYLHDPNYKDQIEDDPVELIRELIAWRTGIGDYAPRVYETNDLQKQVLELQGQVVHLKEYSSRLAKEVYELSLENGKMMKALKSPHEVIQPLNGAMDNRQLHIDQPVPPSEDDLLDNPDFVPCRDERCAIQEVHAVHNVAARGRGPRRKQRNA